MEKLTESERQSAVWLKLKEHYEERLNVLRMKNDNLLDEITTASLRGEIRMIKQFLAIGIDAPLVPLDD